MSEIQQKIVNRAILVIGVAASLFHLYMGWFGPPHAVFIRSIHLIFMVTLAVLRKPLSRKRWKYFIWIDLLFIAIIIWAAIYLIVNFVDIAMRMGMPTKLETWMGIAVIIVVLEVTRRTMGWAIPILAGFFIIYGIFGPYFGYFSHRPYSIERISSQLFLTTEGIFGLPLGVSASFILLFILFGAFLNMSGAGEFFFDLAYSVAGKRRAGPAQTAVIGSGLFGMISGSAVANVSTTGTFSIPLMKKCGFKPTAAGAIEAVASTGGQLMPPIMGAAAFVMAELLETNYLIIAKTGFIPAFFYFLAIIAFIEFASNRQKVRKVAQDELPEFSGTLKRGFIFLLPVIGLIGFLAMNFSPAKSAVLAITLIVFLLIVVPKLREKLTFKNMLNALKDGATGTVSTAMACASAGIIVGMVNLTGLGLKLSSSIISLAGGSLHLALLMIAVACLVLGMGVPTTAAYIIVAVLGAPALMQMGVRALNAHFFVFYFAVISNITPPVALAAYAGAGIADSPQMKTAVYAFRYGFVAYVLPFLFIYRPAVLLMAPWYDILRALVTVGVAVFALAIAIVGWVQYKVSLLTRAVFFGAAILLFQGKWLGNIFGMVIFSVFLLWILHKEKLKKENM
ncbi:MAG: C4-dicarboxylate ABC transporter permease [Spirochaetes bacterium]|nr:MAG: C4-dicarboxylate ABC transporter permease [Spirochaetota bacterium]